MFEFNLFGGDSLRTTSALYGCSICPPPGEPCPDFPPDDPRQEEFLHGGYSL
jgi:hypothetical protein